MSGNKLTLLPRLKLVVLLLLVGIWNVSESRGDIAPDPLTGGESLSPKSSVKVVMQEETVRLKIGKDACYTEAVFLMQNPTDKPITLPVGFPVFYTTDLLDFKATVDAFPVKKVEGHPRTRRGRGWKTWEMTFPPGKITTVGVSYRHQLKDMSYWSFSSAGAATNLVELVDPSEQAKLRNQLTARWVRYILRTGRAWAGPIGRCRIEFTFTDGMSAENIVPQFAYAMPRLIERFEGKATWELTEERLVLDLADIEPTRDIDIMVSPHLTRADTRELFERFHKRYPTSPQATLLLAALHSIEGRKDEARKLRHQLLRDWQERISLWGPESEDQLELRAASRLWSFVMYCTYDGQELVEFAEAGEAIEAIARRLEKQFENTEFKNERTRKRHRDNINRVLEWCRRKSSDESRDAQ